MKSRQGGVPVPGSGPGGRSIKSIYKVNAKPQGCQICANDEMQPPPRCPQYGDLQKPTCVGTSGGEGWRASLEGAAVRGMK